MKNKTQLYFIKNFIFYLFFIIFLIEKLFHLSNVLNNFYDNLKISSLIVR